MFWSINQSQIQLSSAGSSTSLVYESNNEVFWVSRLAPEEKLERLVLQGKLEIAAQFAKKYELDMEMIYKSELKQLIKNGNNFKKVRELVEQIKEWILGVFR